MHVVHNSDYSRMLNSKDNTGLFLTENSWANVPYVLNLFKECTSKIEFRQQSDFLRLFFKTTENSMSFSVFFDFFGSFSSGFVFNNKVCKFRRINLPKYSNFGQRTSVDPLDASQSWWEVNHTTTKFLSTMVYLDFNRVSYDQPAETKRAIKKPQIFNCKIRVWVASRFVCNKLFERGTKNWASMHRQQNYTHSELLAGTWLSVFFGVAPMFVLVNNVLLVQKYDAELATSCFSTFFALNLLIFQLACQEFFLKKMYFFWNTLTVYNKIFWFFVFFLLLIDTKQSYYVTMSFFRNCGEVKNFNRQQWWSYFAPIYHLDFFTRAGSKSVNIFNNKTGSNFIIYTPFRTTLITGVMR